MAHRLAIGSALFFSLSSMLLVAGCQRTPTPTAGAPETSVPAAAAPDPTHYDLAQAADPNGGKGLDALDSGGAPSGVEGPHTISVSTTTSAMVAAAAAARAVDPYATTLESVRQRGLGCFSTLVAGAYSATIVMTTTAAGTVIDASVESSNVADAPTLACLKALGNGTVFPYVKDGGRTVRVVVSVQGR